MVTVQPWTKQQNNNINSSSNNNNWCSHSCFYFSPLKFPRDLCYTMLCYGMHALFPIIVRTLLRNTHGIIALPSIGRSIDRSNYVEYYTSQVCMYVWSACHFWFHLPTWQQSSGSLTVRTYYQCVDRQSAHVRPGSILLCHGHTHSFAILCCFVFVFGFVFVFAETYLLQ